MKKEKERLQVEKESFVKFPDKKDIDIYRLKKNVFFTHEGLLRISITKKVKKII